MRLSSKLSGESSMAGGCGVPLGIDVLQNLRFARGMDPTLRARYACGVDRGDVVGVVAAVWK